MKLNELKVGDKVIMRKGEDYYHTRTKEMLAKFNYVVTIEKISREGEIYWIEEDEGFTYWTESSIEELYIEPNPIQTRFEILDL